MTTELRDILYFDFEKVASVISQTGGGLSRERTEQSETSSDKRNIRKYDLLKVFKSDFEVSGDNAENIAHLERAFRAIFPAIKGMEQFTSFHHYPRIVIHPIAVYRTIRQSS